MDREFVRLRKAPGACSNMGGLRKHWAVWIALAPLWASAGCGVFRSDLEMAELTPVVPAGAPYVVDRNPLFVPLGPESYGKVFEGCLGVLGDFGFEIYETNRYSGAIDCLPRIAPGLFLILKPGSPNFRERVLATTQTYRHRVSVQIQPADSGGFFIEVIARKEQEDLPRPLRSTVGGAIFRNDNNVERQFEVIDATFFDSGWIYRGRDEALEQEIIRRLKNCM
ncbi:MAG: hypothetical protein HY040_18205 [Planctomycetes bacterium]|nr:hypothetical protein [Planctomycetota bacterium]